MRTLRILHLEDNGNDAALVAAALAAASLRCEFVRVDSRSGFIAALDEQEFDLILSDYSMPGFDGVSAHSLARARRPAVPFLFVSGTMGEEVAVDCLKDGAADYVLKHRLARLAPAVRRALEESRNRSERAAVEAKVHRLNDELQVALGQANSLLDSLIENLPDVVVVKDAGDLRFLRVNRACEELLGIPRRDLIGRQAADLFPRATAAAMEAGDRTALATRSVTEDDEDVLPSRDRGARVFHTRRMPLLDGAGKPTHLVTISADVTERRAAEHDLPLANVDADRAKRAKSELLSPMEHDLRTPPDATLGPPKAELPVADTPEAGTDASPAADTRVPGVSAEPFGTILFIEDSQSNVRLLQRLLGRRGAVRLLTAQTGAGGLELARREHPDLVLLDLHLPDMPGEEVLRRLSTDPATRPLPVAVLSADATSSQRQRLLASGAIACLAKPLDLTQLLRLIDDCLASHS